MKGQKFKYAWIIFAVFLAAYFFVYFHRMSLNVVGPYITEVVGGNYVYLSSIYFWTYAAMQIPCGMLADRFGPRKVSFVFLLIATAGSALTAVSDTFMAAAIGNNNLCRYPDYRSRTKDNRDVHYGGGVTLSFWRRGKESCDRALLRKFSDE